MILKSSVSFVHSSSIDVVVVFGESSCEKLSDTIS
jgi:hypothetical protein